MKCLVVDDEPTQGKLISIWLKSFGHESEVCQGGYEAIKCLQQRVFDLLITDLAMPEMSGIKLATYVETKYDIPIIIVTGYDQYVTDALNFWFVFFKPQGRREFKELLEAVEIWMKRKEMRKEDNQLKQIS